MAQPDIAKLWDLSLPFVWDEAYVDGLEALLRERKAVSVLDAAGGTGFPSIELCRRGLDVTYADGSETMHTYFERALLASGMTMPHRVAQWSELSRVFANKFDAVLCRGNSLVYVNSWDEENENRVQANALRNIEGALAQFRLILRDGGCLFVDLTNHKEFENQTWPLVGDLGTRMIDGRTIECRWEVSRTTESRMRIWTCLMKIDGEPYVVSKYSYPLMREELLGLLKRVGFSSVQEPIMPGKNHLDVFVAIA